MRPGTLIQQCNYINRLGDSILQTPNREFWGWNRDWLSTAIREYLRLRGEMIEELSASTLPALSGAAAQLSPIELPPSVSREGQARLFLSLISRAVAGFGLQSLIYRNEIQFLRRLKDEIEQTRVILGQMMLNID
ncbi:MAG: hypothetical protein AAF804_00055 [Bacteroidota bacterium]